MAYVEITSGEITSGEPVTNGTQTKIKDNLIAHESRITSLEGGSAVVYAPIIFRVNGQYDTLGATSGVLKTVANFNLTITGVRIYIDTSGSSGTTEIDIKYSRSGGAYTSILTTKPSVAYSAGHDAVSSNAILDVSQVNLQTGDIIRLDTTSVQTAGRSFMVRIDFSKT